MVAMNKIRIYLFFSFLIIFQKQACADVKLPALWRDSMVLQRDSPIKLWGWSDPNEKITIDFNQNKYSIQANKAGNWSFVLPAVSFTIAIESYDLNISAKNKINIKNILFGDVFICSGQSNMVINMERVKEKFPEEIAQADYALIRYFFVPNRTDLTGPKDDMTMGYWKSANPKDVLQFSAVAYFFAKSLYSKYHVPIGLINASVGGTPIEAWISEQGFKDFPEIQSTIQKNKDTASLNQKNRLAIAFNANHITKSEDKGMAGLAYWYDPHYKPQGWRRFNIPGYIEDQGIKDFNGVMWFRRELDIPASMTGIPSKLFMGRIVDADYVYINGQLVGNVTYQYPPRRYEVPTDLLKPGKNLIVIRLLNTSGKGGFVPDKNYSLISANGQSIDLKGDWLYKVGEVYKPIAAEKVLPVVSLQNQPTSLFNTMIAPLTQLSVKGVLWYQGETNAGNPAPYNRLLPALIQDWRAVFHQSSLPFLYVQLANFMDANYLPVESQWAELREAQLNALNVPNTAMAVTIDLGEWNDIHPLNKKSVGERLALAARNKIYGEKDLIYSGPVYQSNKITDHTIILSFDHTGSGLTTSDGEELSSFAIAGADKKWGWAKAKIEDNHILVWSDAVTNPLYVRYAWADNPDNANLMNKEGLPASPFRTDK
jgi:sialate O-acetylesterase